jgi:hypothetical protein
VIYASNPLQNPLQNPQACKRSANLQNKRKINVCKENILNINSLIKCPLQNPLQLLHVNING